MLQDLRNERILFRIIYKGIIYLWIYKKNLEKTLILFLRENNEAAKRTIRVALSSIKLAKLEAGKYLDDSVIIQILQKEINIRREMLKEAQTINRDDLIGDIYKEIEILELFLPEQLDEEELTRIILDIIKDHQTTKPSDIGKVMKAALVQVAGRPPNQLVNKIVMKLLC